jgi:hypothetical protein
MNFLAKLARGDVGLWRVFWLIGIPLSLIWDFSVLSTLAGYDVGGSFVAIPLITLFALSSVAIVFVSVAVWRSASKYPREVWWQTLLALAAKLCAVFSGLVVGVSFLVAVYLAFEFIYAGVLPI